VKISTKFTESPLDDILYDVRNAKSIFVCTASITSNALSKLDMGIPNKCKKLLISGMFSDNFNQVEALIDAKKYGWKVGIISHLHAKITVVEILSGYAIYIGSSNLSLIANSGERMEFNVRLFMTSIPSSLKSFMRRCEREMVVLEDNPVNNGKVVEWGALS
jgi:hypothetical protein